MKVISRVLAVMLAVVLVASLFAACGDAKKGNGEAEQETYMDSNVVGTWKQTDEIDGNWTWTFNSDLTCSLSSEDTGFNSTGTYYIESEINGKIHISLKDWSEEKLFTYAVTTKVLDLESMDASYHCFKQ